MVITESPAAAVRLIFSVNKQFLGHATKWEMDLMTGTAATESRLIQRAQTGGGPARGIFQIEPETARDVYRNYLRRKPNLYRKLMEIVFSLGSAPFFIPTVKETSRLLTVGDDYSIIIARCVYLRRPEPIPTTLGDQAAYYKRWYNTPAGKGSEGKYIRDWKECDCAGLIRPYIDDLD